MATESVSDSRSSRVQEIVDDCIARRVSGEALSSEQVVQAHQELMPELGEALRKLSVVEQAEHRARTSSPGAAVPPRVSVPPADAFAGYILVGEIHRGGQGVVYEAIQRRTQRRVAIKSVFRGACADAAGSFRFEREVQILGMLDHPNIPTIHDTGRQGDSFYYVTDCVHGDPLDVFVVARELPTPDILRLFAKVCDAVNAAHLLGIIHRDLKPSNVLVDQDGEPHVLDFGLSKTHTEVPDPARTATGEFVGSLPWASPEQLAGSPREIDIRTDVYSLGVMLYQALTQSFPYAVTGTMREVMENILEAEPRPPSSMQKAVDDELDAIVLKCLAKDRMHRYQTAGELARDLRHYLAGEPIEAKQDSVTYVLAKHLRKFRVHLAIALGFAIVITAGLVASVAFWGRAAHERDNAIAARALAEHEAQNATAANNFVREVLSLAIPAKSLGRQMTIREAVDMAARNIDAFTAGNRDTEAAVRATLGRTYHSLGYFEIAAEQLKLAAKIQGDVLGEENPKTLSTQRHLAGALNDLGYSNEAFDLLSAVLEVQRRVLPNPHPDTLDSCRGLAWLLFSEGKPAQAEPLFREALEGYSIIEGPQAPSTLEATTNLASVLIAQGRLSEAEPLAVQGSAGLCKSLGERHPTALYARSIQGWYLYSAGAYADAELLFRDVVQGATVILGPDHPHRLYWLGSLAWCVLKQGRAQEAEALFVEVRGCQQRALPPGHPHLFESAEGLVRTLISQERFDEAQRLAMNSYNAALARFGDSHRLTLAAAACLADLHQATGNVERQLEWRPEPPSSTLPRDGY